jgi:hypothetical protein
MNKLLKLCLKYDITYNIKRRNDEDSVLIEVFVKFGNERFGCRYNITRFDIERCPEDYISTSLCESIENILSKHNIKPKEE